MPGRVAGSLLVVSERENGYRLDHYAGDGTEMIIMASFVFRHQRKTRLVWWKAMKSLTTRSLVDVRLRHNYGSTVLELHHSALASRDESMWYTEMWVISLGRLQMLQQSR